LNKNNPARTASRVWWIITAISFVLMFFPFFVDGAPIGIIIAVFALIILITGFIAALIYSDRAGKIDRFIRGEDLLAHWTYTPDEWQQYAEKESIRDKSSKKTLFFIISGIVLFIGIVYTAIKPQSGIWVMSAMIGLIIIIGFVAWLTGWYNRRQNIKYHGEAFIRRDGVYLNRRFHQWNQVGSYLNSVQYVEDIPPVLSFSYFALTGTITQEYKVHVPVPKGQEARAKELLAEFNKDKGTNNNPV
jgi:hypothetical protein